MMALEVSLRMELDLTGGMTDTIFPRAEKLIYSKLQERLQDLCGDADGYQSVMDWVFCSIHGAVWKRACFAFYRGKGKPLREILTKRGIARCERRILAAFRLSRPDRSWEDVCWVVRTRR